MSLLYKGSNMRIAICLYGNVGLHSFASSRKSKTNQELIEESSFASKDIRPGYNGLRHTIDNYHTDLFIHSWSTSSKDTILSTYKPKLSEVVKQKDFTIDPENYGILGDDISQWKCNNISKISYKMLFEDAGKEWAMNWIKTAIFRSKSRWWSNKRCIELKKQYEEQNGFTYDYVLINRFDNIFVSPFNFESLDGERFYASARTGRRDRDYALFDYWFLCNSENSDIFSTLYDHIYDYSVSAVFAPRQHVESKMGKDKLSFLFKHNHNYRLYR